MQISMHSRFILRCTYPLFEWLYSITIVVLSISGLLDVQWWQWKMVGRNLCPLHRGDLPKTLDYVVCSLAANLHTTTAQYTNLILHTKCGVSN